ncbi:MAG TPA: IPT/TIG domain-containing protein, partial [Thermoanaerobaculia bacterium]|nr:IPT/TIG domain-containing protein [Thermoanaerobaculia bacterium]
MSSFPDHFVTMGSLVFFNRTDFYGNPMELWRTDGTEAGTFYLAAGGFSKVAWNGRLWFLSSNASNQIWSTDGTVAGTTAFTLPSPLAAFVLMAAPDHLYFFSGSTLWRTDGTTASVVQVSAISFTPAIERLNSPTWAVAGQTLYFIAQGGSSGPGLWRTDSAGTSLVKDMVSDYPWDLMSTGSLVFFIRAFANSAKDIWRSDGTPSGTFPLKSSQGTISTQYFGYVVTAGQVIYFTGSDGSGTKLWRSDGQGDAVPLGAGLPGVSASFDARPMGALDNGTLILIGPPLAPSAGASQGIWAFNGADTVFLANTAGGNTSNAAAVAGNYAVLGTGGDLWRTDGTAAGTFSLGNVNGSDGYHNWPMTALGKSVLFGATDPVHGYELWKTDGSIAGTGLLKDVYATTNPSWPKMLRSFNGGAFFTATSDVSPDLWFSDGTDAGTQKLLSSVTIGEAMPCGARVFFSNLSEVGMELWASDGTLAGTTLVKDIFPGTTGSFPNGSYPGSFACSDDRLFFFARSSYAAVAELWRSDGTSEGTLRIKQIPVPSSSSVFPPSILAAGHDVFFALSSNGQLWRSDGTPAGTVIVKYMPNTDSIGHLIASGPFLFMSTSNSNGQTSLWRSDGTEAGTQSFLTDAYLTLYADFFGRPAFSWSAQYTTHGLCTSDGTATGTTCFDPAISNSGGWIFAMYPLNGRLYYNFPDLRGTDGTTSGSTGVGDVDRFLTVAGGRLYVVRSYIYPDGNPLVETDGSPAGTQTILGPKADEAVASGGRLFISAGELYAYDLPVTPTSFTPRSIPIPGGQTVTVVGRGFTMPATVTVGGTQATVTSITDTAITFFAPSHDAGSYIIALNLGDGRRITLDDPLRYTCAPPTAKVGAAPAPVYPLVPVVLHGSGGTRCAWFPETGLDDPSSCTPQAT